MSLLKKFEGASPGKVVVGKVAEVPAEEQSSFSERLRLLGEKERQAKQRAAEEDRIEQEEEARIERIKAEEMAQRIEALKRDRDKWLLPILQTVNCSYLHGRGVISAKEHEGETGPWVSADIVWDKDEGSSYDAQGFLRECMWGNRLRIHLLFDRSIFAFAGRGGDSDNGTPLNEDGPIKLGEGNWSQALQDLIIHALEGEGCHWSFRWAPDRSR